MDLTPFKLEMQPIPERIEAAIRAGVCEDLSFPLSDAYRLLEPGNVPIEDGVIRNPDGTLTVCCRTDMPGVTAQMIDWWFCWHTVSSERYNLWHPSSHMRSFVREDRTHLAGQKAGYIGQASYVDEYIGKIFEKLIIKFVEPESMGLNSAHFPKAKVGTAICARGGLQDKPIDHGGLIHLIRETSDGVEMISRFWLGDIRFRKPLLRLLLNKKMNTPRSRRKLVPDQYGLDLLRHCAEEMNHLARFLPALYHAATKETATETI
jgi:hypothetical protein